MIGIPFSLRLILFFLVGVALLVAARFARVGITGKRIMHIAGVVCIVLPLAAMGLLVLAFAMADTQMVFR